MSSPRVTAALWCLLLVFTMVLASCAPQLVAVETGPRAWVGGPPDGSEVPLGPISVMCHGYAEGGVAHLELWVNGAFVDRAANTNPGAEYFTASISFETTGPGPYVVHCRTYGEGGEMVQSEPVTLTVPGEEPTPTEEVEIPTATPTEVPPTETVPPPTETSVPPTATTAPPTSTPVPPTSTPIPPTATPSPQPPSIAYFRANGVSPSITVNAGTQVTLSWEWQAVTEGYLDPGNIPMACPTMPCTYQVTPPQTTTYTLKASGPGGQTTAQVTVVVQGDTTGPQIQFQNQSTDEVCTGIYCSGQPTYVDITFRVTDPSGVKSVQLFCTVTYGEGGTIPEYQCGNFSHTRGDYWSVRFTPPTNWYGHDVDYRVRAVDDSPAQNTSWWGTGEFIVRSGIG